MLIPIKAVLQLFGLKSAESQYRRNTDKSGITAERG